MAKQALEGSRFNGFMVDPNQVTIIGLDTEDGPEHPLYDPRVKLPLDPAMVANVKEFGVETPIMVAKQGDQVLVVAGRQRTRWCRAANEELAKEGKPLLELPVTLKKGDDVDHFGRMLTENEVRQDDDLLTKAEKAERYMAMARKDKSTPTLEETALRFGVTDRAIRQWLAILQLSPKVKKAVKEGKLSATAASKLQGLSVEEQEAKLDEAISEAEAEGKKRVTTTKAKNKAGGQVGPSRKIILKMSEVAPHPYCTVLAWVLGEVDDSTFLSECPQIAKALDRAMGKDDPKKKK